MKKLLSFMILSMLMVSILAGCGTKEDADNSDDGNNTENTGAADTDNNKEKLIVGTEAGFAPYEYMEGDKVVGIDMDIAQAIADSLGRELEIKNMDFTGALMAVQNGTIDFVAAGVSVDEERQKVMDFSIDYVDSTEVIVVNKENPMVAGSEDLKDKIIGVQQGNIADFYVEENIEFKEIKRYTKFSQATEDLKNRKIDCIVMDLFPAQEMVASNPELIILEGDPLFQDKYAIAVKKGNTELLEQINEVIQDLKDNGKIEEFTAVHTK
ncbi:MAG: putative secreted protein [Herbinix sp.]|jgi:polar amino acid transport system substrate-binding protein|nr:putative secreted protein [Herbinix sp.]